MTSDANGALVDVRYAQRIFLTVLLAVLGAALCLIGVHLMVRGVVSADHRPGGFWGPYVAVWGVTAMLAARGIRSGTRYAAVVAVVVAVMAAAGSVVTIWFQESMAAALVPAAVAGASAVVVALVFRARPSAPPIFAGVRTGTSGDRVATAARGYIVVYGMAVGLALFAGTAVVIALVVAGAGPGAVLPAVPQVVVYAGVGLFAGWHASGVVQGRAGSALLLAVVGVVASLIVLPLHFMVFLFPFGLDTGWAPLQSALVVLISLLAIPAGVLAYRSLAPARARSRQLAAPDMESRESPSAGNTGG